LLKVRNSLRENSKEIQEISLLNLLVY
jgi:hypothetical protein